MAQAVSTQPWEKPVSAESERQKLAVKGRGRWKFLVGGLLILAAVGYLVISGTLSGARFFITVDELMADPAYVGQTVRIAGAVIGDTIAQDGDSITFTIAHIPKNTNNLGESLHLAANDTSATRLVVTYEGAKPDLLQHEAQAILSGTLDENGVFHANELLLKCPSRFQEGSSDASLGAAEPPQS